MVQSCNHCCHENTIIYSLCTVVDIHVAVNNTTVYGAATEMQQYVPFALLSSYKIFLIAVNIINIFRFSYKVPNIFVQF